MAINHLQIISLLLSCLFLTAISKHELQIPICQDYERCQSSGIYTDALSGTTTMLVYKTYPKYVDFGVHQVYPNNTVSDFTILMRLESIMGFYDDTITGANDGKHIFVTKNTDEYKYENYTEPRGEGYFMESADGGLTWSKPMRIPRSNMSDNVDREIYSALYINETGRTYIFLSHRENHYGIFSIKYTTRASGSSFFSKEAEIFKWEDGYPTGLRTTYTLKLGRPKLHMFAKIHAKVGQYYETMIMYSSSLDGIVWDPLKNITRMMEPQWGTVSLHSKKDIGKIHVAYTNQSAVNILQTSYDHGKAWNTSEIFSDFKYFNTAYCNNKLFILIIVNTTYQELCFYDENEQILFEYDEMNWDDLQTPVVSCLENNGKYTMFASINSPLGSLRRVFLVKSEVSMERLNKHVQITA